MKLVLKQNKGLLPTEVPVLMLCGADNDSSHALAS